MPQQAQKWIDWDQTRKEQRSSLTKMMVSVWFKKETNPVMKIDLLEIMKEERGKAACNFMGKMRRRGWKSVLRGDP